MGKRIGILLLVAVVIAIAGVLIWSNQGEEKRENEVEAHLSGPQVGEVLSSIVVYFCDPGVCEKDEISQKEKAICEQRELARCESFVENKPNCYVSEQGPALVVFCNID